METLRVLITDDEMGMRLGAVRTLRAFVVHVADVNADVNFVVDEASSGEQALEKIQSQPPDILLLDHKMPGISGLDVLDRLVEMNLDILTIMITAYASIETAVTATKRGAYDFLAKPFTPDELKAIIRKAAARIVLAKQARKLAEEKRQVRFQFVRVLGHELKAPLGAVEGYLRMFQERSLGDRAADYAELVDRSLVRVEGMKKLIADLLDMTQLESGQKNRHLAPLDLRAAAEHALETFAPTAEAANVTLALHADSPLEITADSSEIEMIFSNLISNAIKYNRQGGRVDVTLSRDGTQTTITVADTGIGMSPEDQSQLFGEFVRIRNAQTANILGSGLGLSILKRLAALYDGDVTVESQPNIGSTFRVCLS